MKTFALSITSIDKKVLEKEAYEVLVPAADGEMGVLADHMALISPLVPGEVRIKYADSDKEFESIVIGGGFIEILSNHVNLLVHSAERVEEIDEKRAEEAREKAQKALEEFEKKQIISDQAYAQTAAALQRALARLKVVRKNRRK
jgi:F-type H+-transporting ATPase subunit epsilon